MKQIYGSSMNRLLALLGVPAAMIGTFVFGLRTVGTGGGSLLGDAELSAGVGIILVLILSLQGWVFARGLVSRLSSDGERFEARTFRMIGPSGRVTFTRSDIKGVFEKAIKADANSRYQVGWITVQLPRRTLELDVQRAWLIDLDGLAAMDPAFIARLKQAYPGFGSR